ncbi:isocitrate lyase/PEP mutase family protein [Albidovulum sp.]|uniref:isocitrate lyase/PEP mutase family protein n=1 Tax=Albidovulum sp. TaxID=1872424 RepID=UPI003D7E48E8
MAAAQGYPDGQVLPLEQLLTIAGRIVESTDLPVSIDFEGGYATSPEAVADNLRRIIAIGAVGINFEDRHVGGQGLFSAEEQARRIAAIRAMADAEGVPLFINARTDLFLQESDPARHTALIDAAAERAKSYQTAGANGFFVPGLGDPHLIGRICDAVSMPVNVMCSGKGPGRAALAGLGVARISYGPAPYQWAAEDMKRRFAEI